MNTVKKNITMPDAVYETINAYAKKNGMTFSEFLRENALKTIKQNEEMGLLQYLDENCGNVDDVEQAEIESLNLDFENFVGKEITLDELLQS